MLKTLCTITTKHTLSQTIDVFMMIMQVVVIQGDS